MKFKQANTYTIQCMGQDIRLKSERNNEMFRVLGIYNFAQTLKRDQIK